MVGSPPRKFESEEERTAFLAEAAAAKAAIEERKQDLKWERQERKNRLAAEIEQRNRDAIAEREAVAAQRKAKEDAAAKQALSFNALAPGQSPLARDRPRDGWRLDAPHSSPFLKHQPGLATGGPGRIYRGQVSPVRAFDLAGTTPLVAGDDTTGDTLVDPVNGEAVPLPALPEMRERGLGRSRVRAMDLSRLELGAPQVDKLVQGLAAMHSLQTLAFVCCALRPEDMPALSTGLLTLPRLRELELGRNRLQDAGAITLSKALPHLRRLAWLGLAENGIGPEGMRALGGGGFWEGGLQVGEGLGLRDLPSLTKLEVSKNRLADVGATHVAAALAQSATLTSLRSLSLLPARVDFSLLPARVDFVCACACMYVCICLYRCTYR